MNEIDKIKEEVEQRLQQQQANKEFKDVGRVAQTKKEKSAYKIISSTLLRDIELDPVMAFNMIKKDTVWLPIDVQAERDRGNTSGAVYFKVKLRESLPAKPKNDRPSASPATSTSPPPPAVRRPRAHHGLTRR